MKPMTRLAKKRYGMPAGEDLSAINQACKATISAIRRLFH